MKKEKIEKKEENEKNKGVLETKFRSGAISCAVFSHEIETEKWGKKKFFTFVITRGYKDKNDEWQNTSTFRKQDIAAVEAVLRRAADYLLIYEDEEEDE